MSKKILLVDDDKTILEAVHILLTGEGYDVKVISDGRFIENEIEKEFPNLILLDYRLPGKDGWLITKELKKNKNTKSIPVIMISADNTVKKVAKDVGVDAFLAKPFDIDNLIKLIKRFIK